MLIELCGIQIKKQKKRFIIFYNIQTSTSITKKCINYKLKENISFHKLKVIIF